MLSQCLHGELLHTDTLDIFTKIWLACVLGYGHVLTVMLMRVQRSRRTGRMH